MRRVQQPDGRRRQQSIPEDRPERRRARPGRQPNGGRTRRGRSRLARTASGRRSSRSRARTGREHGAAAATEGDRQITAAARGRGRSGRRGEARNVEHGAPDPPRNWPQKGTRNTSSSPRRSSPRGTSPRSPARAPRSSSRGAGRGGDDIRSHQDAAEHDLATKPASPPPSQQGLDLRPVRHPSLAPARTDDRRKIAW